MSTEISLVDPQTISAIERIAALMSRGAVTVPKHLASKPADCFAIALQAMRWNMDPFVVAQKTFLGPGQKLGYESQLVNAVLVASGTIVGQPSFEFIGDWLKVIGKCEERQSKNTGADGEVKKYYVPTYTKADEAGLGVVVKATLAGENEARALTLMMSQCYPRFSTQWATDPQQQICYRAVAVFARRHCPGAILGVITRDEIGIDPMPEPYTGGVTIDSAPIPEPKFYPEEKFKKNFPAWEKKIRSGSWTPAALFAKIGAAGPGLSDEQKAKVEALVAKPAQTAQEMIQPQAPEPTPQQSPTLTPASQEGNWEDF